MKQTKKILAGAVTLFAAVTLAACSNAADKDIITMKGNTITVSEFYEKVKTNSQAQQVLLSMVISNVFENQYGDKVSAEEVNKEYDKKAEQLGASFNAALSSAGLTEESYKEQIRTNKLVEYAVKQAAEKELTDENYKAAYDAYTPEVTARIIKLADEAKAKEVLAAAQAEGADFAQLAKDNSTDTTTKDNGGEVKFDSTSTTVPAEVQKAVFALDAGQVGASVISSVDMKTYTTSYYVVKLDAKSEKSAKWEDYKDKLKEIILAQKQRDSSFVATVLKEALQKANVKVKDSAFQNLLSQYVTTEESSASSTKSSSSSTESSSSTTESSSSSGQ
ncbi:TPA: peptidylprolyl isomerase PrsA [Streptococcus suis]|uniref:peptidylprolyl isomerase PrsA n=1 Tax=Streptococcus suis TaxID=1307 RepID=UPI000400395B|nr:peptidylprolyl isomerase PrsA [Streptococcus suis]MDW8744309.1 peptidylprolyl isomerase PrsA [Streptococcus suis]HEL1828135.1 peptidylprolyl isomerase PrsA [Streptococcus suis]HEL1989298.1 peptidylprolyl isomerase PrsA [Streptococcus suis]HEL1997970.1 peptidylprolyl isomerase PrsA [Streptococcus suis]HEL2258121.1 peptidylprolyl isomerase PrsA [Streptococcus suis]